MKTVVKTFFLTALLSIVSFAQKPKPSTKPAPKPSIVKPAVKTPPKKPVQAAPKNTAKEIYDAGKLDIKTYSNRILNLEITFPASWLVADKDFEDYMLKQGFDVRMKTPPTVKILQTAYKFMPGINENSIIRIAVEDLSANPQIKDAVDYFDAQRTVLKASKLPADFKYSETKAEKLGAKQFAYLDTSSNETGKRRAYATIKNGYALMFMISYTDDADIEILRTILTTANFAVGK